MPRAVKLLIWYGKTWGILMFITILLFGVSPDSDQALLGIYALIFLVGIVLGFRQQPAYQYGLLQRLDAWYGRVWMIVYFVGVIPQVLGDFSSTILSLAVIPLFAWFCVTQTLNWAFSFNEWRMRRKMRRMELPQAIESYVPVVES